MKRFIPLNCSEKTVCIKDRLHNVIIYCSYEQYELLNLSEMIKCHPTVVNTKITKEVVYG